MLKKLRNMVFPIVLILTLALGGTGALAAQIPENVGKLTVSGNAVISADPDTAHITLGVETSSTSADVAAAENAQRMAAVMEALRALGLTEKEISTSGYNIYSYSQVVNRNTPSEETITTYQVQNRINITTKNLDQVGRIIDAAVKAGANQVQGIRFDLADKQELQLQALQSAIKQAKMKAEAMAASAGVELQGIVSINEDYGTYVPLQDATVMRAASYANQAETSITPGEIEVTARVTMVFWF